MCNLFFTLRMFYLTPLSKFDLIMSRQEVYSWAALLSNIALIAFYCVFMFGFPGLFEPIQEHLFTAIGVIILIDFVFQIVIELQRKRSLRLEKDERDNAIEAEGFRVGYHVFLVAIIVMIGHLFTMSILDSFADPVFMARMANLPLHYMVLALVLGSSSKSITQLIHYRRGA